MADPLTSQILADGRILFSNGFIYDPSNPSVPWSIYGPMDQGVDAGYPGIGMFGSADQNMEGNFGPGGLFGPDNRNVINPDGTITNPQGVTTGTPIILNDGEGDDGEGDDGEGDDGEGDDEEDALPLPIVEKNTAGKFDVDGFKTFLKSIGLNPDDYKWLFQKGKGGEKDELVEGAWPMIGALLQNHFELGESFRTNLSAEQKMEEARLERAHGLRSLGIGQSFDTLQNFAQREHESGIAQLGNEEAYGSQALANIGAADVQRLQNYGTTIQANRAMSTPEGYASYVGDSESPIGALKNYQTAQLLRNTGGLGANLEDALRVRGNDQDQARALAYIQSTGGLLGAGGMINPELARHQQNLQRMQSTGGYSNPYDFMMTQRLQAVDNPYAWLEYQGMKDQMMADRTAWQDQYGQMGQQGFGSGNNIRDIMFRDGAPAIYPENMQKTIRGYESRVAQPDVRSDGGLGALENQGMLRWIPGNRGYSQYQAAQQARQNRADTQANQWFTMATPPEVTTSTSPQPPAKPGVSGDPSKKYDPFHPYYMDGIT